MLLLVGDLIEGERAVSYGAEEGALACVDPQVIEEVVPLTENFLACLVVFIAYEDALPPACLGTVELHLREFSCHRYIQTTFEQRQV